jgi:AcrR family transcriptional regulator
VVDGSLSGQVRGRHSAAMRLAIEAKALELFERRSFASVTVDDIAAAAGTSTRTFYRYFPTKDDVLQVRVEHRAAALQEALAVRPLDEAPLRSIRLALTQAVASEDAELVHRWIAVITANPSLVRGVLGGVHVRIQAVTASFLSDRLGVAADDLAPTMLAAAVGGVAQASMQRWFVHGGDLAGTIDEGLAVLERMGRGPSTPAPA